MNMKPIAVLQSLPSGAKIHLMSADYAATYGTDKAVSHPVTNRLHALYENLAQVPTDLPEGTQISLPTSAVQVPIGQNTSIYNDVLDDSGNRAASVYPSIVPIIGIIIALTIVLFITIVVEFIFADYVRMRIKEITPPCAGTVENFSNVNQNVAFVQNPDCSSYTVDKNTGQVISQLGEPYKAPGGGFFGDIQSLVVVAVLGIGGIILLQYLLRPSPPKPVAPQPQQSTLQRWLS